MNLIVFNATSQAIAELTIAGTDVTGGKGMPGLFNFTGGVASGASGITVSEFAFDVEVVVQFESGDAWRQWVNNIGSMPPVLFLFCYSNGYMLSLPGGTIKQGYTQSE